MSEEEKRRCIILGICGGGSGLAPSDGGTRKSVLAEYLPGSTVSDEDLDKILGLIDEALQTAQ